MPYRIAQTKEQGYNQLKELVSAFENENVIFHNTKYKEAQLRGDFIDPFLKAFGWDVDNEASKTQFLRDVVQEETIEVEENDVIAKKNPDYTLRVQGSRKLFVEAKMVSIDIEKSSKSAFQTRRYGWNANLGISILTNFEKLVIYDCRYKPESTDNPNVARYKVFHYKEFLTQFDNLYELLSFQSITSGYIDNFFSLTQKDVNTFDDYFLKQIETWRYRLATNIIINNSGLNEEDINFLIQRLLNRIVFLRICEDREIEKHETLKGINNYDELKALFHISDKKYNSGLFDFIEDQISLNINLNPQILIEIFKELYYPESPYDFAVVDPAILSQIYERYLGSKIKIISETEIEIIEEPEVAASSGVVPTPKHVVENIIKETLAPLFFKRDVIQIKQLKIADICCGSGTFLISVYDYFVEQITLGYINSGIDDVDIINEPTKGIYKLTLKEKQKILLENIYGVDINPYAVEVAKFSLLLKILEGESAGSIDNYIIKYKQKVLPTLDNNIKVGNSLVDDKYFEFDSNAIRDNSLLYKVKPFNWENEYPFLKVTKGFDAIIGNPPYVRIQNIVKYLKEEIKFYQNDVSGYTVAESNTFDKYYLFIQRGINLLNPTGILGYIIPNKFFVIKGGTSLRSFIVTESSLYKILHFGIAQVFPNRSTYTAVLILDKNEREKFWFKRIRDINTEFIAGTINYDEYQSSKFTDLPWIFVSKESEKIFNNIINYNTTRLINIADIPVGLQTSKDDIFIIKPHLTTMNTFKFKVDDVEYEIEKNICKPCLMDLQFELFDTIEPNAYIIFPYTIEGDRAIIFSEAYFESEFPLTWSYLNIFKDILSKRKFNKSKIPAKWYQFGRTQSLTKFHSSGKLIWPVLSTKPGYIYDENNLQFTGGGNGPYYSLISTSEYSIFYILGILCHPIFEAMVKAGASEFRGSYYSHGKQFIKNIPIRQIEFSDETQKKQHDDIVNIVNEIIMAKREYNVLYISSKKNVIMRKLDHLYSELVLLVNQLYQITQKDINIILQDEMFITDIKED